MLCELVASMQRRSMPTPDASGRRHAVGKGADVVFVHLMSFFVAALALGQLSFEAAALVFGIVEFAEAIGNFHLSGDKFPSARSSRARPVSAWRAARSR